LIEVQIKVQYIWSEQREAYSIESRTKRIPNGHRRKLGQDSILFNILKLNKTDKIIVRNIDVGDFSPPLMISV
jgi:hypothetical protein